MSMLAGPSEAKPLGRTWEVERTLCSSVRPAPRMRRLSNDVWNLKIARRTQLPPMVPLPSSFEMDTSRARPLSNDFWVETPAKDGRLLSAARRFCATLNAMSPGTGTASAGTTTNTQGVGCRDPTLEPGDCGAVVHGLSLVAGPDASLERPRLGDDESYDVRLRSNESVVVVSATSAVGGLRGLTTAKQLVTGLAYLPFQSLHVKDAPAVAWRGIMLDTARHYIPPQDIRTLMDAMAEAKLNVLHWHIVDASSFPLVPPSRPEMARGAYSPDKVYSAQTVRALVQFAAGRGIRVVPEIDMPAHVASWGPGAPFSVVNCTSLQRKSEWLRLDALGLNLLDPRTRTLIEDVLRDVAGAFQDEYVHVGGDELPRECWLQDEAFMTEMRARGETIESLATAHFDHVTAFLSAMSKKAIMWQEAFDQGYETGSSVVMQSWKGWGHPSEAERAVRKAVSMKTPWLNSGGWYLDYADSWDSMAAANEWMAQYLDTGRALRGEAGRALYVMPPPRALSRLGLGGEGAMWTEHVDYTNLHCRVWPRAGAIAETLWRGPGNSDSQFRERTRARDRVRALAWRFADMGVPAAPTSAPFRETASSVGSADTAFSGTDTSAAAEARDGMQCPGITQDMHRPLPNARTSFMTYNVLDGGLQRIDALRAVLVRERPHVVAVVEANNWANEKGGVAGVATELGYAFSVHAPSPSGYDVVVLSWRPLEVVQRITEAADGSPMSRAAVHVRVQGWDIVAAHLNPGSATARMAEMQALAAVAQDVAAAGRPLVLMGDLNSLSPMDAACHTAEAMTAFLERKSEAVLRQKFSHSDDGALAYKPMLTLLNAGLRDPAATTAYPRNESAVGLLARGAFAPARFFGDAGWPLISPLERVDEEGAPLPLSTGPVDADAAAVEACSSGGFHGDVGLYHLCTALRTVPTGIQPDQTGEGDTEPPLRVDYVLFNDAALAKLSSLTCNALHDTTAWTASDHAPVVCRASLDSR